MHLRAAARGAVRGVNLQVARERTAQRLVRRNQRFEAFVDLPVLALAPPLYGLHEDQADADRHQRNQNQAQQRGGGAGPRGEVDEIAHA
ncbi:MAG: hypothetical protein EOO29_08755 [Comamonadaceae bacterium]|nr:MAG: hypothetical protein EOO29_08755 [Comamonadaceae bacterium]